MYLSKTIRLVWIGQDHLWGSLYVTECSFDRPHSRVRAHLWFLSFGYFGLTTLLHWGKGGEQSFPLAQWSHYFLCHVMEVYCYHSLWEITLQVLSAPFTLGFVTIVRHKCFQVFNWVRRMSNSFCLDFKVSIVTSLENPSRLSRDVLTKWRPRTIYLAPSLPQEM